MRTAGKAGGRAPEAITWRTSSAMSRLRNSASRRSDVGGADRQAGRPALIRSKSTSSLKVSLAERCRSSRRRPSRAARAAPGTPGVGPKKAGMPAATVEMVAAMAPNSGMAPRSRRAGRAPRGARTPAGGPAGRRAVAGDQAGVDRADRGADHPVRLDAGLVQRLIDAGLVGAERPAALQHQHAVGRRQARHLAVFGRWRGIGSRPESDSGLRCRLASSSPIIALSGIMSPSVTPLRFLYSPAFAGE